MSDKYIDNSTQYLVYVKGFIPKTAQRDTPVNVYQILPEHRSDTFNTGVQQTCSNTNFAKHFLIKNINTPFFQPNVSVHTFSDWKGLDYNRLFSICSTSDVHLVLFESLTFDDASCLDYFSNIDEKDIGILTDPTNSTVVGMAFRGHLPFSFPYYVDMCGSKHMVLRKLYENNYNIANLTNVIPFKIQEISSKNSDIDYIYLPTFYFVRVFPQEAAYSEILVDEEDMFKEVDENCIPDIPPICVAQTNIDTLLPFKNRMTIVELQHQITQKTIQALKKNYEKSMVHLNNQTSAHQEKLKQMLSTELQNIAQWKESEIVAQRSAIQTEIAELKQTLKTETEEQLKHEHDMKYADMVEQLNKEKIDLQQTFETEKISLSEKAQQQHDEALRTTTAKINEMYANQLSRLQKDLSKYEETERKRIETLLNTMYEERRTALDAMKTDMELKIKNEFIKTQSEAFAEELRTKYINEYMKDYQLATDQMNETIDNRRQFLLSKLSLEIAKLTKVKQAELKEWTASEQKSVQTCLSDYLNTETQRIDQEVQINLESKLKTAQLQVEHYYTTLKQTCDNSFDMQRIDYARELKKELEEIGSKKHAELSNEIEMLRQSKIVETTEEVKKEQDRKREDMNKQLEREYDIKIKEEHKKYQEMVSKMETQLNRDSQEIKTKIQNEIEIFKQAETKKIGLQKLAEMEAECTAKRNEIFTEISELKNRRDQKLAELEAECTAKRNEMLSEISKLKNIREQKLAELEAECTAKRNEMLSEISELKKTREQEIETTNAQKRMYAEQSIELFIKEERQSQQKKIDDDMTKYSEDKHKEFDEQNALRMKYANQELQNEIANNREKELNRMNTALKKQQNAFDEECEHQKNTKLEELGIMYAREKLRMEHLKSEMLEQHTAACNEQIQELNEQVQKNKIELEKQSIAFSNRERDRLHKLLQAEMHREKQIRTNGILQDMKVLETELKDKLQEKVKVVYEHLISEVEQKVDIEAHAIHEKKMKEVELEALDKVRSKIESFKLEIISRLEKEIYADKEQRTAIELDKIREEMDKYRQNEIRKIDAEMARKRESMLETIEVTKSELVDNKRHEILSFLERIIR